MTEHIDKGYKSLLEVRLLHHYWLDEGKTVFDSLSKDDSERRLLSYDVQSFLAITPTATATKILAGIGGVYKDTSLGCTVLVPSNAVFPTDTVLEFVVTVKDAAFFNYTALTLRPQKIYEFFVQSPRSSEDQPPEIKVFRYKENVPVLSNETGTTRQLGGKNALFLSQKFPESHPTDLIEFLVVSGNELLQLISDDPAILPHSLGPNAADLPVFVHQADVPAIVPPSGVTGVPTKGIQLSSEIPDNVFALVQLSPLLDDNDDFSFVDKDSGLAKAAHPIFQIRFKNRSTFWQYLKKENGEVIPEAPKLLPLTYFGNAGSKQKPSVDFVEPQKNKDDNTKISKLVSKVFV
jgi:hypothetical protein